MSNDTVSANQNSLPSQLTPLPRGDILGVNGNSIFLLQKPAVRSAPWTSRIVSDLTPSAGGLPGSGANAAPALGPDGSYYGVTVDNGGVVYRLTPPSGLGTSWTYQVIHTFPPDCFCQKNLDGSDPLGIAIDRAGALYGYTLYGGHVRTGVIFKLSPPAVGQTAWAETILYTFQHADPERYFYYSAPVLDKTETKLYFLGFDQVLELDLSAPVPALSAHGDFKKSRLSNWVLAKDGSLFVEARKNAIIGTYPYPAASDGVYRLSPSAGTGAWPQTEVYTPAPGSDLLLGG